MLLDLIKNHINFQNLTEQAVQSLLDYLKANNYIDGNGQIDFDELLKAVELLHKIAGVKGGLSLNTFKLINLNRCGHPDLPNQAQGVSSPGFWGIKDLTYAFDSYVNGLTKDQQKSIAKRCFDNASSFLNLTFRLIDSTQNANFVISSSSSRKDGLGENGNVLAYNFLPPTANFNGQLLGVFDLAEIWIDDPTQRGILYQNVFAHEVTGHGLGLDHSQTPNQLMNPYYSVNIGTMQNEDRARLLKLYGPSTTPTPTDNKLILEISGNNLKFNLPGYRIQKLG